MLQKIISTGHTSVERAALDAARSREFPTAGWCAKARFAGNILLSEKYSLLETPSKMHKQAYEWNVRDSDGTIMLIGKKATRIEAFVEKLVQKHNKHSMVIRFDAVEKKADKLAGNFKEQARNEARSVSEWLQKHNIDILNIQGSSARRNNSLPNFAYWLVWCILQWDDRFELCLRSPRSLRKIMGGKYSNWAVDLEMDTLEGLLSAVGDFGIGLNSMRLPSGEFLDPDFHGIRAHHGRVRLGMEGIAIVQAREINSWLPVRLSPEGPSELRWTLVEKEGPPIEKVDSQLSNHNLAFVPEFQKRLSSNDRTCWAQDLSEKELETLMWMVGEYGIRMFDNPPPGFPGESRSITRLRAALQMIGMIYSKKCKYNVSETKSWICTHSM